MKNYCDVNPITIVGGSGGSGGSGRSSPSYGTRSPAVSPRPVQQAPPQQVHHHYHPAPTQGARPGMPMASPPAQGGGMMSGLGGALATGMAVGAGSEIAHQAIRGIMGGGSSNHGQHAPVQQQQQQAPIQQAPMQAPVQYAQPAYEQPAQQNQCYSFNQSLMNCLKSYQGSIDMCQQNMDMLTQCEKDSRFSTTGI